MSIQVKNVFIRRRIEINPNYLSWVVVTEYDDNTVAARWHSTYDEAKKWFNSMAKLDSTHKFFKVIDYKVLFALVDWGININNYVLAKGGLFNVRH